MESVKRKEALAENIVKSAEEECTQIIDSAQQKKEEIFKKIKEEYLEKYEQWKATLEHKKKREVEAIMQEGEEKRGALGSREQEIVNKVSDFLIEALKNYGHRKR
jgi:vacuolar-type H+-ATPase subunit H